MTFSEWCERHKVDQQAVIDLLTVDGIETDFGELAGYKSESGVQRAAQVQAAALGGRLWRNNSGAGTLDNGSFVRWGLCNESAQMNRIIKSADLIGIMPHRVTTMDVGRTLGLFVAAECKTPGWQYHGTDREKAQAAFLALVTGMGGRGLFVTDPAQLTIV